MGGRSAKKSHDGDAATREVSGKRVQIRVSRRIRHVLDTMSSARGDKDLDATIDYLLSLAPETATVLDTIQKLRTKAQE